MKRYKPLLKEENSLSQLKDVTLVDKLFDFIIKNPFPKDHEQLHKFAESLGIEADQLEIVAYAIISAFLCGGRFYDSGKKIEDLNQEELKNGIIVEQEHVTDKNLDNPVVKRIVELMKQKISADHVTEKDNYYSLGQQVNLFDELSKK